MQFFDWKYPTMGHSERSEESLLHFCREEKGIPRFARNDGVDRFLLLVEARIL